MAKPIVSAKYPSSRAIICLISFPKLGKWIVEGGIDDEWDDYVAQITSMAAPSLAIYQEALDAYYGG